jgi:hypothetical protein
MEGEPGQTGAEQRVQISTDSVNLEGNLTIPKGAEGLVMFAKSLEVIPGASHLFEEPGTLEKAPLLARQWFQRYLTSPGR